MIIYQITPAVGLYKETVFPHTINYQHSIMKESNSPWVFPQALHQKQAVHSYVLSKSEPSSVVSLLICHFSLNIVNAKSCLANWEASELVPGSTKPWPTASFRQATITSALLQLQRAREMASLKNSLKTKY